MNFKHSFYFLITIFTLSFIACEKADLQESTSISQDIQSINLENGIDVENLASDEAFPRNGGYYSFRTLSAALHCTGLNTALFDGNKTIYAPSDAAFEKLGLNRHNICDNIDVETLINILLYHVVDRKVKTSERGCIEMIDGNISQLSVEHWRLFINDSKIYYRFTQKGHDYRLRVFVITDVLMPPANTIVEAAAATDKFSSLVAAVLAANPEIATALSDPDAIFTVFAPTNQAFADLVSALGFSDLNELVAAIGVDNLSTVLLYHVVDGCAFSNNLSNGQGLTTLQREDVTVDLNNLSINDKSGSPAGLVADCLDILTANGIVHTINKVLLPQAILDALN